MSKLDCLVSGGQTGVDRAALDVALALGIPCGGWCPRGRRAEDGAAVPPRYPLIETETDAYRERTWRNVRDADATLILCWGAPCGGTRRTAAYAATQRRPCLVLDLAAMPEAAALGRARAWLAATRPAVLNVAGPRESEHPGAHSDAARLLHALLAGNGGRG